MSGATATVGTRVSDSDLAALRAAAVGRAAVAATVAAVTLAGARWSGRPIGVLLLVVALVWLPWASFLLVAGSSHSGRIRHGRLIIYGGPLGDVLIVFAAQCLVPWAWGILLLADAFALSLAASL